MSSKISQKLLKAAEYIQLADNEMDRLGIIGKSVVLSSDQVSVLELIIRTADKMKRLSDQVKAAESGSDTGG